MKSCILSQSVRNNTPTVIDTRTLVLYDYFIHLKGFESKYFGIFSQFS